jgi:Holliday junction resolvase RusA-like endonuclease
MSDQLFEDTSHPTASSTGSLAFTVVGTPAPQGSKKGFYNKHSGRVQMVESSAKVAPWRDAVKYAALEARNTPGRPHHITFEGAVSVGIVFGLPRPKGHYGTGRNAGVVKASAPVWPAVKPDLDKLTRSTLDALREAGVYRDDARVVRLDVTKAYCSDAELPGATIVVSVYT